MVDISKIKPGDMVVLKPVKVISIQWYPGEPLIADVGGERVIVQEDEISEHIPAPREFKVGCRVEVCTNGVIRYQGEVRGIDGDYLFVRRPFGKPASVNKEHCKIID